MSDAPIWEIDGRDWPNRAASRFVQAGDIRWHVQVMGEGPVLLLLHGTGAATHSWRDLAPILTRRFTVVAPDLPGHGFTSLPPSQRLSLPWMAWGVQELLHALGVRPALAVGHSAGAAVAIRMTLDRRIAPRLIVGLNGALMPFEGLAGQIFAPIARLLVSLPGVASLFAWRGSDRAVVEELLRDTGSTLSREGVEFYARLVRRPDHVAGALGMMANWDLPGLVRDLPQLAVPLLLIVGHADRTVPPETAARVRARHPPTRIRCLPGLGHLAHEERPELVARILFEAALAEGILAP
jgi:magnesium chelatase accessory protein